MYKILNKPLEMLEGEDSIIELQLKNQTYNNGVYSFVFTARCADSYMLTDNDFEEYVKIFKELFPHTPIIAVLTATIKFDINENDIIVSDTLLFNMEKLQRYSIEVIDAQLYKSDFNDREMSEIINRENVTSILISHNKSKELLSYLKDEENFFTLIPGYGYDTFPNEWDGGFEFEEE